MVTEQYGRITDEALAELAKSIGEEHSVRNQFNECATKDNIRHFVHGIGDTNPLWTDEEYAKKTRWGSIIAPPTFLFTMTGDGARVGLPGVHQMWSGAEFQCFLPIRVNDCIRTTVCLSGLPKKQGEFAGIAINQEWTYTFKNQNEDIVAKMIERMMRTERHTAREKGKYASITPHHYTEAEIQAIEADYDREEIRGANPRYWEDVKVEDKLTHVVKGPLTVTDCVAWKIGYGNRPFIYPHRIALEYRRRHPAAAIPNSQGVPDVPERVHWDNEFARQVGVPAAYDFGTQRVAWLGHLVTNWMGDDGFIRRLMVEVRRFNIMGDTTWCRGKVTKKYIEDGQYLVDCEMWANNQRGEVTARGEATVILPSRKS